MFWLYNTERNKIPNIALASIKPERISCKYKGKHVMKTSKATK